MMLMPGTYCFSLSVAANKLLWCSRYPVRIAARMLLALLAVVLFLGGKTMGRCVPRLRISILSPWHQTIAKWLVYKLHDLNHAPRSFITGGCVCICPLTQIGEGRCKFQPLSTKQTADNSMVYFGRILSASLGTRTLFLSICLP